jgi:CubicO group peptidase (beta-lactamase class C family)
VIQRAGEQLFPKQIQEHIANPLHLESLQMDLPERKANWSVGYEKSKLDKDLVSAGKDDAEFWKHGAGAYKSNIADFAKWAEALLNKKMMKPASYQLFFSPQLATDERSRTYGLGIRVDSGKIFRVHHNGKQDEATSRLEIYPDEKSGIVVLTNCDFADTTKLAQKIGVVTSKSSKND